MKAHETLRLIEETGVIAILRGTSEEQALYTAEALASAGLKAIEVTFNTPGADRIISAIAKRFAGSLLPGAGTVTTPAQAVCAKESGAQYILAPNTDEEVIRTTQQFGLPMIPGAFTPSEVIRCAKLGCQLIKVFPVSTVGPQYIKDLKSPFDTLSFLPVGGVDLINTPAFIKAGAAAVGVGGSLIQKDLLARGDYAAMTDLAKRYLEAVASARA